MQKLCQSCGRSECKPKWMCPTRLSTCFQCHKKGHWSNVCRSDNAKNEWRRKATFSAVTISEANLLCSSKSKSGDLNTISSAINGQKLSTLIDTGSSKNYLDEEVVQKLGLSKQSTSFQVQCFFLRFGLRNH